MQIVFYLQVDANNNIIERAMRKFVYDSILESNHRAIVPVAVEKCVAEMKMLPNKGVDSKTGCNQIVLEAFICIENTFYSLLKSN